MTVPHYKEMMLPALRVGADAVIRTRHAVGKVADILQLSESDRSATLRDGRNLVLFRLEWAVTYLYKNGLVVRPRRGHYTATDEGRKLLAETPSEIPQSFLAASDTDTLQPTRTPTTVSAASVSIAEGSTPEEKMEASTQEVNAVLRRELLDKLRAMEPTAFEALVLDLMRAMGYGNRGSAERVGGTADGGIDGIIDEDALGLDKIYLQAKRYTDSVISVERIREFSGALDGKRATKGVFVTTSRFTPPAEQFANTSTKSIKLIDGEMLAKLMIEYDVAVRTYSTFALKKLNEDYFEDLGA